jgi:spoIIIJ-associated protein
MGTIVEKTAKTVQIAINEALDELGATADDVVIEVLDEGDGGGILGIGRRPAKVRVSLETELAPVSPETEGQAYYGDDAYSGDPESPEEAEATAYVAAVLSGIGIHGKISSYREENTLFIDVNGSDSGAAIGRHGETLEAIQYLASLVANKASQERVRVILDIGGYRRRREITLISMAEKAAESVVRNGRNFTLEPMNPSERRIVHSALQSFPGVMTYSEGEEPERHVIIAPNTNV